MLRQTLKNFEDSTLWLLLADVGEVMGNSRRNDPELKNFWLSVASEINSEINGRLFDDSDDDLEDEDD